MTPWLQTAPVSELRLRLPPPPDDWPRDDDGELPLHDAAHPSSEIERWQAGAQLELDAGIELTVVATMLRVRLGAGYGHVLTTEWRSRRRSDSWVRVDDAVRNAVAAGAAKRLTGAVVSPVGLDVDFGSVRWSRDADGYRLRISDDGLAADLRLDPVKPPLRYGAGGHVDGPSGERLFAFGAARCAVRGRVDVAGVTCAVAAGTGWWRREFGVAPPSQRHTRSLSLVAQLDDGSDLVAYALADAGHDGRRRWLVRHAADGSVVRASDVTLWPTPSGMSLRCRSLDTRLELSGGTGPSSGRGDLVVDLCGVAGGAAVVGQGWLETRSGT